jgi:hypothetical protein
MEQLIGSTLQHNELFQKRRETERFVAKTFHPSLPHDEYACEETQHAWFSDPAATQYLLRLVSSLRRWRVMIETRMPKALPGGSSEMHWRVVFTDGYRLGTATERDFQDAICRAFLDTFCDGYMDKVQRMMKDGGAENKDELPGGSEQSATGDILPEEAPVGGPVEGAEDDGGKG